jgi:integrase
MTVTCAAERPSDELRTAIGRPNLRIHDLRHTFATILFDAGASAPDVQATLGHSSLQVTERYSRAREGVALRAGAALNDALKKRPGRPTGNGTAADPGPALMAH